MKERIRKDNRFDEYIGKKFGMRTITEIVGRKTYGDNHLLVKVRCDCGKEDIVRLDELQRRRRWMCKECGYKHQGIMERTDKERLYEIWRGMKKRCYNQNALAYKWYGAKGIVVCEEWKHNFEAFYNWSMSHGYKKGLTIDRINSTGNYEPDNCRWTTQKNQVINRGLQCNNTSGYAGIRQQGKRWHAAIKNNSKKINLGTYDTLKEAVEARNRYIKENNLPHKIQEYKGE